jgi:hypothetical protein
MAAQAAGVARTLVVYDFDWSEPVEAMRERAWGAADTRVCVCVCWGAGG